MNINDIVKNNLCGGCGICEAICPANCIEFKWINGSKKLGINFDKCIDCGKCYQVCPGKIIESREGNAEKYESYLGQIDESFKISQRGIMEMDEKNKDVMGVVFV